MSKILIIGKTNAGKSLLFINLIEYLGLRQFPFITRNSRGFSRRAMLTPSLARLRLVSPENYYTKLVQEVNVQLYKNCGSRQSVKIMDTPALCDGIHPDPHMRKAMLLTLQELVKADIIIHVVDLSAWQQINFWGTVDREIMSYGQWKFNYFIAANKIDLPEGDAGYNHLLTLKSASVPVVPISVMKKEGFKKVIQKVHACL